MSSTGYSAQWGAIPPAACRSMRAGVPVRKRKDSQRRKRRFRRVPEAFPIRRRSLSASLPPPPCMRGGYIISLRRGRHAGEVADGGAEAVIVIGPNQRSERGLLFVVQGRFPVARVLEIAHDVSEAVDVVDGMQAGRFRAGGAGQNARQFLRVDVVHPKKIKDMHAAVFADEQGA